MISNSRGSIPTMLVADDDPCVVRLLVDRCTRMGFEVSTATSGLQALVKASQSIPDILVIDVHMPEIDGLSVCANLSRPTGKPANVIVISGHSNSEIAEWCEDSGAEYIQKGKSFWNRFEAKLCQIFPEKAASIRKAVTGSPGIAIKPRARVLVIDDDANVRRFLKRRLEQLGMETLCAVDGTMGFSRARREEPTVIVADCFMQNGDAEYLLLRLRVAPETSRIPVIVQSGRYLNGAIRHRLRQEIYGHPGAARIIQKSFDARELLEALQRFCGFATNPALQFQ
jgi:CheY-like chemotaxis protein